MKQRHVRIKNITAGNDLPFVFIAGPDSLESLDHALFMAKSIKKICDRLKIPYIFKAAYDKANRTSVGSFRGVGLKKGLEILKTIQKQLTIPVTTDVHSVPEAQQAGKVVDLVQVPALLSRQTDLLVAAGGTGKAVNVKKGQFIAPQNIDALLGKVYSTGNKKAMITERGYMFGYNNVVADMRGLEVMKRFGCPVIFDAAHTVQFPSSDGKTSGGDRTLMAPLARAAVAVGIAGIFMEVHDDPDHAPVDGPSSLKLSDLPEVLSDLKKIDKIVKHL